MEEALVSFARHQNYSCLSLNCFPSFEHSKSKLLHGNEKGMLFYCCPVYYWCWGFNLKFLMQIMIVHHTVEPKYITHSYHSIHKTPLMCIYMDAHLPKHTSECFHFGMFAFSVTVWHVGLTWHHYLHYLLSCDARQLGGFGGATVWFVWQPPRHLGWSGHARSTL